MRNLLNQLKKPLLCAAAVLCLVLLLCPMQAHAAGVEVAVYSPTNPDLFFTGAEVYDVTVYLQGTANETYYISYKVFDTRNMPMTQSWEPIPVTLNGDGQGEYVLDLSPLKNSRDVFRAEVTVMNSAEATVATATCNFTRVAKDSVFSEIANVRDGILFSVDNSKPNLYLYLKKTDRFPEKLTLTYWITDMEGNFLRQVKGQVGIPTKDYLAVPLNFYGLEASGQCRISYAVHDDTNNLRASGSYYFLHHGTEYISGKLHSLQNKLGLIYANDEPYDLILDLRKTDHFDETFTMHYTVTDSTGAVVKEYSDELFIPHAQPVSVPLKFSDLTGYGLFTLTVTASDDFGYESASTYSFSRVLATAKPGDLPLVNINDHFTNNHGEPIPKLQLSAQAGFGMWRCSIPWASVEKSRNNYTMPAAVNQVMQTSEELGMEPLIILAYGNDAIYGQPNPTNTDWLEGYANYCKYIASYFGDRITYYEIWNEWNHTTMGKTDPNCRGGNYYAMALAAASKAIKSVNPNAKIIGGAMAGHSESWMVSMLDYDGNGDGKSDAMEAMDGFSFHTYATDWKTQFFSFTEHDYARDSHEVLAVLNRYGDASTKEIWLTETGWSTCIGPGVTEEAQAAYMTQMFIWALANPDLMDRIFWYDLMNDCDMQLLDWDPTAGEHNWGLIHNWTNVEGEPLAYSAKQSYVVACAMNSMMAHAQYTGTYDLGDDVVAYQFQKDEQDLLAVWVGDTTKTINISFEGDLVVTDMYGNSTTYTGSATLELSDCPVYITCAPGAITSIN